MVVSKILCVSLGAGCVAELDVGEFLSCLDDEVLMAEAVGEDDVAAAVNEVCRCFVARAVLGDVGLLDDLCAGSLASCFSCVDEVEVIGRVLIVKEDETDRELACRLGYVCCGGVGGAVLIAVVLAAASCEAENKGECHKNCEDLCELLHFCLPPKIFYFIQR